MGSKLKIIEECTTLLEIEVAPETIDKAFDEVYDEMAKVANIPGFRTGKAPKEIVKKHYAKEAKDEVLKRMIPEAYTLALSEHKIRPAGYPEINDVIFNDGERLSFKAKVDTRPKFKLKDYKSIKVTRKRVSVTDTEINSVLDNLRQMNAKFIAVEDRGLQMGDYAVSDLECYVDGKSAHKKRENLWLFVEKESLIPDLAEKMIGMKKQEERDIEVTLPEKYPDKNLAGKPARYHVLVKEIKLRQLPNTDDEFAKDLGKKDMGELKQEISKELEERAKVNVQIDLENQILNRLMDDNVFAVPSSLVARQLELMVEDAKKRLAAKGFTKEDLDKRDGEFKEKFKNEASRKVRLLFILDEIAQAENIDSDEKNVEAAYEAMASQGGKSASEIKEYYEKEGFVDSLREKLREEKVIEFLIANGKIEEEK